MRDGANATATGGVQLLSHTHGLIPRLGFFGNNSVEGTTRMPLSAVPYDYDELIAAIAPTETLLYSPLRNRFANAASVATAATKASAAWGGKKDAFTFMQPDAPSDFRGDEVDTAVEWVDAVLSRSHESKDS